MDGSRFDHATKLFASTSRRSLLKAGLGSAVGLALSGIGQRGSGAAQSLRVAGEICRKHGDCATHVCGPKDRTGRSRCGCALDSDCPVPSGSGICATTTCVSGACITQYNVGIPCDDGDACTTNDVCLSNGSCAGTPVVCIPLGNCYDAGVCDSQTGICSDPVKPDGVPCDDGNPNSTGETCQSGICTCTPIGTDCGSRVCGSSITNCGQPVSCGECLISETCDEQNGVCLPN